MLIKPQAGTSKKEVPPTCYGDAIPAGLRFWELIPGEAKPVLKSSVLGTLGSWTQSVSLSVGQLDSRGLVRESKQLL